MIDRNKNRNIEINTNSYYANGFIAGQQNIYDNLNISYTYHKHVDGAGNEQSDDYQASTSGGCFTKENIVYTTTTGPCGNRLFQNGTTAIYDDVAHEWITVNKYDCPTHGYQGVDSGNCTVQCTKQVDTGKRYYNLNCGKTTDSIDSATITY